MHMKIAYERFEKEKPITAANNLVSQKTQL